jgi:hypothetical protein
MQNFNTMKTTEIQVKCPSCAHPFAVNEALVKEISQGLQADFEAKAKELREQIKQREDALKEKQDQLDEEVKKLLGKEKAMLEKKLRKEIEEAQEE